MNEFVGKIKKGKDSVIYPVTTIDAVVGLSDTLGRLQDQIPEISWESPKLTGIPTSPTAAVGDSSEQIATTEFVQTALSKALGGEETYETSMEGTTDVTLGGLQAGTPVSALKGLSFSKILDLILFQEYAPRWIPGTVSITPPEAYQEVNTTLPHRGLFSITGESPKILRGESWRPIEAQGYVDEIIGLSDESPQRGEITKTVTVQRTYGPSIERIMTNRGTYTKKTSLEAKIPLVEVSEENPEIDDNYLLKRTTVEASCVISFVYPIYATTQESKVFTKQAPGVREFTLVAAEQSGHQGFAIALGGSPSKIEVLSGDTWIEDTSSWQIGPEEEFPVGSGSSFYQKYYRTGEDSGEITIRITL